ncbi:MAG: hypothetical protein QXE05_04940 [Nitrososphaeria archaeon]
MWKAKIKGKEYEFLFAFSIIFILFALIFTQQSLTRTVEIIDIITPSKVKVGETFKVNIFYRTSGFNLIAVVQAYVSTGQAGQIGPYERTMIYMQNPGTSNITLSIREPFVVTKVDLIVEFLSPNGQGLATRSITIEVEQ